MKSAVNLAVLASTIISTPVSAKVIYGEDGRKDVAEASEIHQKLSRSTPVMVGADGLKVQEDGSVELVQTSLKEWMESQSAQEFPMGALTSRIKNKESIPKEQRISFCAEERFTAQPNPGMCSGFLIAPDLLATAGHCADSPDMCESFKWVFDFKVDADGTAGKSVPASNIYSCKRIITQSLNMDMGTDYAIIQLDRKVEDREPLEINTSGVISNGTEIVVIGNPSGLPLKVTEGGKVRSSEHMMFFSAALDTYQGNSGSAVFNAESNKVEGILVRGEEDFIFNAEKLCLESNRCAEDACRGEDVSRITSVPEIALKEVMDLAAGTGDTATLEKLLSFGVWVDFNVKDGVSALQKAAAAGLNSTLVTLLSFGADANHTDAEGNTALHYLARVLTPENGEALTTLAAAGAKLEAKNKKGETPLMIVRSLEHSEAEKLLMQLGAQE